MIAAPRSRTFVDQEINTPKQIAKRWGRFQDADESAYYEYICRRADITV